MEPASPHMKGRLRAMVTNRSFWILVAMLVAITSLHYLTPQTRQLLPVPMRTFLNRHAVERILFILPVAVATFAFRQAGGLIALALTILIMLPRAIWISPYPADALTETIATGVVGYLVVWMIEAQAREKELRQKAVSRLSAIKVVTAIVTSSLELDQVLDRTLGKVLEVMGLEAGLIFLTDDQARVLTLATHHGVSGETATALNRLKMDEGLCGRAVQSQELIVIHDVSQSVPAMQQEGMQSQIAVPLKSQDEILGVLVVASRRVRRFAPEELELISAIGNEIGVALENARLYERMRIYARQINQAQEEERQRIARDLHDETIQMLIAISRRLEALAATPEQLPEIARSHIESLQELIGNALKGMRRSIQDLRPSTLDHLGLMATLEGLAGDLRERNNIETEFRVTGEVRRLIPEEELVLFRIAQEALNNVRRHSGASWVMVQVEFQPGMVRVSVEDNGCGFNAPERMGDLVSSGRLGLIGMYERARTLDGTLIIRSKLGQGTVVTVDVPVQPGAKNADSGA